MLGELFWEIIATVGAERIAPIACLSAVPTCEMTPSLRSLRARLLRHIVLSDDFGRSFVFFVLAHNTSSSVVVGKHI